MKELFLNILNVSFSGSILIAVILVLRLILKKAPRTVFCLLWLLAGLRLLLPFEIESNLSLQPAFPSASQSEVEFPPNSTPAPAVPPDNIDLDATDGISVVINNDTVSDAQINVVDYGMIASVIWLVGMLGLGLYSLISYLRFKQQVKDAVLLDNGCWESANISTAFVLGFLPPKIYLPAGLSDKDKQFIFSHENTHIARHDHWYKLMGYAVLALHWFNPLVWLGYSLLCRDIEMACDEHVVKYMNVTERKAYSNALLSCSTAHARFAAFPVAFGEVSVKQRILGVLNYRKPGFWVSLIAIVAVLFIVVCFMTSPQEPDLTFLNYENAASLVADRNAIPVVHTYPGEDENNGIFSICKVDGADLARYLDNAHWRKPLIPPINEPGYGHVTIEIEDDYTITIYERGFAKVRYMEEERRYRLGREDYQALLDIISPVQPADFQTENSQ